NSHILDPFNSHPHIRLSISVMTTKRFHHLMFYLVSGLFVIVRCTLPLSKEVGDNVTLECHHATGLDVTNQSVYWQFNSSIHVLVFKSGGFSPDDQGEQFKGRTTQVLGRESHSASLSCVYGVSVAFVSSRKNPHDGGSFVPGSLSPQRPQ
uniref:Ig-like domain-containing protein n=1 Tax=Gasterosteus aculeatus aculeatus TaxID=481459 RepID=A0AAQ4RSP5_GASAC